MFVAEVALLGVVVMCQPRGYVVVLVGPGAWKNLVVFVPTRSEQAVQDQAVQDQVRLERGTLVVVEGLHEDTCLSYYADKVTAVVADPLELKLT